MPERVVEDDACPLPPEFANDFGPMRGGPFSPRHMSTADTRPTTEDMLSILVADLYSRGAPREELVPIRRADIAGGRIAQIEMAPLWDRVDCRYFGGFSDKTEDVVEYFLWVTWTRPNYGGERAWLQCANVECGRRCGRLFLKAPYLVCRACAGVRYPSQLKPTHIRRAERAQAIRAELGGHAILHEPFPPRPKGMHRSRYARLRDEVFEIERAEKERIHRAMVSGKGRLALGDLFRLIE